MTDIIVIGGGPAGMMAAASAAFLHKNALLLEQNEKLGKKMYITGKGRCNVANDCPPDEFFQNVAHNPKFLMSSIYAMPPDTLVALLGEYGLRTKVERGRRVFPASDKSSDVIRCMARILDAAGVKVRLNTKVKEIKKKKDAFVVQTMDGSSLDARTVVIATGGVSYPQTGSTGDGYGFAQAFGHKVFAPHPALAPLLEDGNTCAELAGLTLKNVVFTLYQNGKNIFSERGEMLFTHSGISGPLVLSASSAVNHERPADLGAKIDLKPALTQEKLDKRILRDFDRYKNKQIKNALAELLPGSLVVPMLKISGICEEKEVNSVTKEEREKLCRTLKAFPVKIKGIAGFDEAIITRGGVDVRGVDPSTLQSKLIPGLFFAGEVMDVDALTGGYNMQIAFSTGWLAGAAASEHLS
jgi:hypothetical protein